MYLLRLVYYSHNRLNPVDQPISGEIRSIIDVSARNNAKSGVTGGLIFNNKFFAQVLEGDRAAVTRTFTRILRDPRHSDVVILRAEPVSERVFLDWAMGYAGHSHEIDELYLRFGTGRVFEPSKMSADSLIGLIWHRNQFHQGVAHADMETASIKIE